MGLSDTEINLLQQQAKDFQYIRFTCSDIYGIPRGKTVASTSAAKFLRSGLGFYIGCIISGPSNELPMWLENQSDRYSGNGLLKPAVNKIFPVPWATGGKLPVGEIMCELTDIEGCVYEANPRAVARKQLQVLHDLGYKMYSSFETEFHTVHKDNFKLLGEDKPMMNVYAMSKYEEMIYDLDQKLKQNGVTIETLHLEYMPGQFEFVLAPEYGIDSADAMFKLKEGVKEITYQKGYHTTFMAAPFSHESTCGSHFNFSLWSDSGQNVFYNPDKLDKLSDVCLYFIGGLLRHIRGITVFCSPTVNCYRRLHQMAVPTKADWDIDNRHVAIRVKNYTSSETYIECRLPSGASNPYLVMAAVSAAGIDGIKNKISPPPKGRDADRESLTHTLEESLTALEEDQVIVESLGKQFVEWFVTCKRDYEIKKFGKHDMKQIIPKEIEAERKEYYEYM